MNKPPVTLEEVQQQLHDFVVEREWELFHSPKNLAMGICNEAGELIEHFLWLTEDQSNKLGNGEREAVARELADVQIYILLLARRLNIDMLAATSNKIDENVEKYPVDKVRGRALKYTDL